MSLIRRYASWGLILSATGGLAGCRQEVLDLGQPRSCNVGDQNEWLYDSVMKELYLWEHDLPEVDPHAYDSPKALMADLRVGHDRWSRVSDKATTHALFEEGKTIGFGFRTRRNTADEVIVASVHDDSPAGQAGLKRGDRFVSVGGVTVEELDATDGWGSIYGANEPGVSLDFVVDKGTTEESLTITKDWIDIITVPIHDVIEIEGHKVGYLFFETFVGQANDELDAAFAEFNDAGVTDLVIDLRYNSGGSISISRHFTDLVVGNIAKGQVSYKTKYNDKLADFDTSRSVAKATDSLKTVGDIVFLTTHTTLSASELLINSIRAHTKVELVGDVTGGKPVGSKLIDFCDSTTAPITFKLLNADDVSDYFDGLTPDCPARDDLSRDLGDTREESLAAALSLIGGQGCPPMPSDDYVRPPERHAEVDAYPELAGWK